MTYLDRILKAMDIETKYLLPKSATMRYTSETRVRSEEFSEMEIEGLSLLLNDIERINSAAEQLRRILK